MEETKNVQSSLNEYATFCILSKLPDLEGKIHTFYEDLFTIKKQDLKSYMFRLLNDVQSPYYVDYDNKFLAELCSIDADNDCAIHCNTVPNILCTIDKYISKNMRRYQQTIQVLNYTPQGYYKKSVEEKKEIQQKLDDTIKDYVVKYVAPDFADTINSQQSQAIKDILSSSDTVKES